MPWPVAEVSSRQGTVVHQAALEITVLFTDVPSTLAALRTAAQLSQGLATRIRLLVLQPVPYPLPLDAPHVDLRFYGRRFRTLVERSAVDTVIDVQLCRDTTETLRHRLAPGSGVVIGKRPRPPKE